jgi:hypothetical protein
VVQSKEERKAKIKQRRQTPEYKAKEKEYYNRPENIAKRKSPEAKAKNKAKRDEPEIKARNKAKKQTSEYKAREKELRDRPEAKAKRKKQQSTPEYKARRKKLYQRPHIKKRVKEYNSRPEVKTRQKIHNQKPESIAKAKNTRDNNRLKILQYYSKNLSHSVIPCCNCCGENSEIDFLAIDHIAGRKQMDSESELVKLGYESKFKVGKLQKFILDNNFPKGFQILCHNCNHAKSVPKNKNICPHETARKEETFAMMEGQSSFEV